MKRFWKWLTRPDAETALMNREVENVTALFNSLPLPKNEIPSTIRKVRYW